jgi:CubicO group peptidase (beta-lactamase class C family)
MQVRSLGVGNANPEKLRDGIQVGSLEAARLDQARIASGIRQIERGGYGNIHSLLIFRRGSLVSESYFPGEDENNHVGPIGLVHHNRDTLHDVRSISKSVVALAVLIAYERGHIASLDQPLFDFFPEYAAAYSDSAKATITLRHALTMTAGLEWDESAPTTDPTHDGAQLALVPDPIASVLSRKLATPPGTTFNYNGGLTQLLAAVVERSTGSDIETFTRTNLLLPLGIERSEWARRRDGKPDADSGLRLRSRDLAKIGLLFADRGRWHGRQIVSADLMDEAVAPYIEIPQDPEAEASGDRQAYGYQTWLFSFPVNGERVTLIELSGNGGQKVYIDRERRLMIVITAGDYDRHGLTKSPIDIYFDIVEPALLDR